MVCAAPVGQGAFPVRNTFIHFYVGSGKGLEGNYLATKISEVLAKQNLTVG